MGVMVPGDWITVLALLVAIYAAYNQREQTRMMRATTPSAPLPQSKYWWASRPMVAMAVLVILAWTPQLLSWWNAPPPSAFVYQFGPYPALDRTLFMQADTTNINKYASDYKLIGVAFHYLANGDVKDLDKLQKSPPFDIVPNAQIFIHLDDDFVQEMKSGIGHTNYVLLMVPNGLSPDKFSTLRQAISLGAKVIGGGSGPP